MNRRGFLKLFGKGAAAGAVYAMAGSGIIERIAPDEAETARAEGKTTFEADGTGRVLLQLIVSEGQGMRWIGAPDMALLDVVDITIAPPMVNGEREVRVIGMPREPLPT